MTNIYSQIKKQANTNILNAEKAARAIKRKEAKERADARKEWRDELRRKMKEVVTEIAPKNILKYMQDYKTNVMEVELWGLFDLIENGKTRDIIFDPKFPLGAHLAKLQKNSIQVDVRFSWREGDWSEDRGWEKILSRITLVLAIPVEETKKK